MILTNALSINMLSPDSKSFTISGELLTVEQAKAMYESNHIDSYIGHKDTAAFVAGLLGTTSNLHDSARRNAVIGPCGAIIAQYTGARLPEGATSLPAGAEIKFWAVYLEESK